MSKLTIYEARKFGFQILSQAVTQVGPVTSTPRLDSDCILAALLNADKTFLLTHGELFLSEQQEKDFKKLIHQRTSGLSVAYITGYKEFYGRDFFVTPSVLIPKPDTEILVEKSFEKIITLLDKKESLVIYDVCTGSGCIAISLYKELENKKLIHRCKILCSDISPEALKIAEYNSKKHGCSMEFLCGDLLEPFRSKPEPDVIISNPPYVPLNVCNELLADGRSEPILALNGDCEGSSDGTGLIKKMIGPCYKLLHHDGFIFLETGEYNSDTVKEYLLEQNFKDIQVYNDLEGMPRVLEARKE